MAITGGADAREQPRSEHAPHSRGGDSTGRFQALPDAHITRLTGATPPDDPEAIVTATVVLTGDSVLSAQARAVRTNRRFDASASERTVAAAQARTLPGLTARGATVRSRITNVLNAVTVSVKVRDLPQLTAAPGVSQVHVARIIQRDNGDSNAFTGAADVWDSVAGYTGDGITIGIIDDGIDYYHADFGGSGDPADYDNADPTSLVDGGFPTAKVVGGYDYVGDAYNGDNAPNDDDDPLACGHHGTHVSGTAAGFGVLADGSTFAGPYDAATVDAADFAIAPGSAPEATIRMYKVFGCTGGASDTVILLAIAQAVADGVDVLNMSLGSEWGSADEPLSLALTNAAIAGVLPVVSAGNAGAGPYLVGGPSTADRALSVAAIDTSVLPGTAITGDVTTSAQNSNEYDFDGLGPVTGDTIYVGLGCSAGDYAGASGKIAVADRGDCDRIDRPILAGAAGALAVLFINNDIGYPPVEGPIEGVSIPFLGIDLTDPAVDTLVVDGTTITLDGAAPLANPTFQEYASFTSNGPRSDSAPKPDISAPGVNLRSASAGTGTGALLLSGTSMATPHTAGIAALVVQAHPDWSAAELKGALMGTAVPEAVVGFDVVRGGAGVVDAPAAVDTLATVTTNDGLNTLAFQLVELSGSYSGSRTFTLLNHSASPITYDMLADVNDLGLGSAFTLSFSSTVVTVPAATVSGPGFIDVTVAIQITDPTALPTLQTELEGVLQSINGLVWAIPRSYPTGVYDLKLPLLLVPYGASNVNTTATSTMRTEALLHPAETLKVTNSGKHLGYYDVYQWAITDPADDAPAAETPEIREVGVQTFFDSSNGGCACDIVVFAISLDNTFATMGTNFFEIEIDTGGSSTPEFDLVAADDGLLTAGEPNGLISAYLFPHDGDLSISGFRALAPYNGSVIELPVFMDDLGNGPYDFTVLADSVVANVSPDITALGHFDPIEPAVNNADFDPFGIAPGATAFISTFIDLSAVQDQGALGWLVITLDDASGPSEADTVPVMVARPTRPT